MHSSPKSIVVMIGILILSVGIFFVLGESRDDGGITREYRDEDAFVLEYDAASADECDEGDIFNSEEGVCEYECADEAECRALAQEAGEELSEWGDELESETEPVHEDSSGEEILLATYAVEGKEDLRRLSGTDAPEYQNIWAQIAALSPDQFTSKYIEKYGVFDDAQNDTLAYVNDDDGNGKWIIAINVAGYKNSSARERASTLIHELAHIVTLNRDQILSGDEVACKKRNAFFTGEGCALTGTYIHDFTKRFWLPDDLAAVGGGDGENESDLHDRKPDNFVSEYASTNPGEDIAESFALFILDPRLKETRTRAEEKAAFFYAYPALVSFRNDMRTALITGVVRAKRATR